MRILFPFTAIVGQENMKLALILSVINPGIGGVLLFGHRGTGKSTIVRSLADLLPEIEVDKDCEFNCDLSLDNLCPSCSTKLKENRIEIVKKKVPMVTLPLGATEDKICGTIDIEAALRLGIKRFEPGLLAKANRGFLYIDEVNLLEDHLVDLLLDVAASGVNIVEREGVSIRHQARFVLVGSGNPEEGDLRPQLLDRFGLYVEVETIVDPKKRIEILKRRMAFEEDPAGFYKQYEGKQQSLRNRILKAKENLNTIDADDVILENIAKISVELGVDGHRGELTAYNSSIALSSLLGRSAVSMDEVFMVAEMSFVHRMKKHPLDEIPPSLKVRKTLENIFGDDYIDFVENKRNSIFEELDL